MVSSFASGISTALNCTLESIKELTKATFLASLSSLAIMRVASNFLHSAIASASIGLCFLFVPVSTSVND